MLRTICTVLFLLSFLVTPLRADQLFESSHEALQALKQHVVKLTLPNGLRILLYRRGIAPVFSGVVSVGVGGVDEVPGETGISHMFEHMAFKGTPEIGTKDFEKEKELLAKLEEIVGEGRDLRTLTPAEQRTWEEATQSLSALWDNEQFSIEYTKRGAEGLNATTDKEQTRYFVSLPRTSLEFWCFMESERLLRPVMRQFYQERDVVLEERRMRFENEPSGRLYEAMLQKAFTIHPYRNPVIGYQEDIMALTATKLDAFRKRYYVPSNIVISIVGDIDPEKDISMIEKYFGRLPTAARPAKPEVVEPEQSAERRFSISADAAASFMIAYRKPHFPSPEDAKITVLSEVLNGSSQSPLFTDLVKKGRYAAGIEHEEGPGVEYPNLLLFSIAPKAPFSNQQVLEKFDESLNRFLRNGAPPDLLAMAKRSIASEYLGQMRSDLSLASSLAGTELQFGDWSAMVDWYDQAMKVSMKDVRAMGRKYLKPQNRIVGFLEGARR